MMSSVLGSSDVRQTLDQFRRSVDQLFENFYGYPSETARMIAAGTGSQWLFSPAVETAWGDATLNLRAILPGVAPNDVKVTVQNNQLVIEGERKTQEGSAKSGYTQLTYGRFRTDVSLPPGLDLDKVNCNLRDGILDIQIPVAEKMRPRQIQVQAGEQRKSISA
jgi:HSP20 family protein